ncbi:MAG: hypothetical protein WDM96_18265 [Lacunisphaera sp.]
MTDSTRKTPGAWRPALFLFVMATLIPELLIGSTPLSRLNQLIFQFPLYGSAALVIRELVIRFRLGRAGLAVLGLAYGVTIEGLALQSLFNPHFLTLDISFGRAGEVNWPWTVYMAGYHALWSATLPVMLAELAFPQRATESWLGHFGTGAFLVLLAFMVFAFHAIFVKMSGYQAPAAWYAGAALTIALLVVLGLQLKRREPATGGPTPARFVPGVFTFLFGLLWLGLYGDIFRHPHLLPAAGNIAAGPAPRRRLYSPDPEVRPHPLVAFPPAFLRGRRTRGQQPLRLCGRHRFPQRLEARPLRPDGGGGARRNRIDRPRPATGPRRRCATVEG